MWHLVQLSKMFFLVGIIVIEAYSLRLSVTELGSITPTELDPALPTDQSPAVGGAGPGPSQKVNRARPGTPPTVVTEPGVTLVRTN